VGVFCKKKWTLPPQNETKLNQTLLFYFTFYLFGGAYSPNAPPAYGHAVEQKRWTFLDHSVVNMSMINTSNLLCSNSI